LEARVTDELPIPLALILDLDGTLVDTVGARIDGWLDAFAAADIPAAAEEIAPLIGMDGKELARRVARAHGRTPTEDEIERLDRAAGEAFDRHNRDPRALPGARELLIELDAMGLPWVIATSSRAEQVRRSVGSLGLEREPVIVDGSHVERAKPEPDLLLLAAERLGAPPATCWSIGDATWDIRAARAAGMTSIGVTAGSAVPADELRSAGAGLVVDTLDALAGVLHGVVR
jgi:HAD superfamily hydrolase (TIGR01509 family)